MRMWGLVLLLALIPAKGLAGTIQAATCSQPHVQNAINSASDGDTVVVPAGTCTWTATVSINKGITIQGAGIDVTTILINHPGAGIRISTGTQPLYRVTQFTIKALVDSISNAPLLTIAMIVIEGTNQLSNWRIDHVKLTGNPTAFNNNGVGVTGPTYGVIDHSKFDAVGAAVYLQESMASDPVLYGDNSWARAIDWGGSKAVYVEDSTFLGGLDHPNGYQVYDGRYGARFVFRHNTVRNAWIEPHSGCPTGWRAVMHNEIYDNTFEDTVPGGGGTWIACRLRGGTGVIFNNTITDSDSSQVILIDNQRSCLACNGIWAANPCDGTSSYDGNQSGQFGWPCIDQIGRGANQASEPLYGWGNT